MIFTRQQLIPLRRTQSEGFSGISVAEAVDATVLPMAFAAVRTSWISALVSTKDWLYPIPRVPERE